MMQLKVHDKEFKIDYGKDFRTNNDNKEFKTKDDHNEFLTHYNKQDFLIQATMVEGAWHLNEFLEVQDG